MAGKVICTTNNVDYSAIRQSMVKGARTVEEATAIAGVCGTCEGCQTELPKILKTVCTCKQVPLQVVVDAVKNGAEDVETIGELTGAGTVCTRCQAIIENIIETGR